MGILPRIVAVRAFAPFAATGPLVATALLVLLAVVCPAIAQSDRTRSLAASAPAASTPVAPSPAQDDATLYDIATVGARQAVAVGELGVVWRTDDGGKSWRFVPTPVNGTLRSVRFLTDRVGWIVGHETDPYTRLTFGIVLATTDGGASWQRHAARTLPALMHVHFFDLENGIAVGEASAEFPTGVFLTEDGGKTWRGLPGSDFPGWRTGCFVSPNGGIVVGLNGRLSLVGNGRMIATRIDGLGQRTLRGVELRTDRTGWLVGEGALLLRTENGGVVWKEPAKTLPTALRDFVDFHGVASHGTGTWVVGSPGSAVWHTPDAGKSWITQPTGVTAPLHDVTFVDAARGFAVGAFGTILRTENGGEDWTIARGGARRAATLAVHARLSRVGFELLAKQSADLGYRGAVLVPSRPEAVGGAETSELDLRLNDAVVRAGGSAGMLGWRFPLAIPGLETNSERLLAEWSRRSEGRLPQVMLGSLVATLRLWRPTVVVLDQPSPDDAATNILNDGVIKAVAQAADATRFPAQQESAGLGPWEVERIWLRMPDGSQGHVSLDPHEFLPRVKRTAREAAALSIKTLSPERPVSEGRRAYRLAWERGTVGGKAGAIGPRDFFAGFALNPGGDARRALLTVDDDSERERKLAERTRNFQAIAERSAGDARKGAQMIAQLRESTAGLSDEQAALQLTELAQEFARQSRWDLVESTRLEIVARFPDEPATIESMRWLFQSWAGAEPSWRRARSTSVAKERFETNVDRVLDKLAKVEKIAATDPKQRDLSELDTRPDPLAVTRAGGRIQVGPNDSYDAEAAKLRSDQAVRMATLLRKKNAALFRQPEIQFPLAALMRRRGIDNFADSLYRRQQQGAEGGAWRAAAEAELGLIQAIEQPVKPMHLCRRTTERPQLDGVLSDLCWQDAAEIKLRPADESLADDDDYSIVLMARDAEYLYLAGSFHRHEDAPPDAPVKQGRTHDADLSRHDRIAVCLDVDRDYATYYTLQVDQRGFTADACWDDVSWNPKWFVAAAADETHWRFEAAIRFDELGPSPPALSDVWAVGIVRTIPAVGLESWTAPAASRPRPETFGFVRFP